MGAPRGGSREDAPPGPCAPQFTEEIPKIKSHDDVPVRHFLVIVRGIFLKGQGVSELWGEVRTLAGMALAALVFSVRRFPATVL